MRPNSSKNNSEKASQQLENERPRQRKNEHPNSSKRPSQQPRKGVPNSLKKTVTLAPKSGLCKVVCQQCFLVNLDIQVIGCLLILLTC